MISNNYFSDNPDLLQQFEKIIPWNEIITACEDDFSEAKLAAEAEDENNFSMAPSSKEEALDFYRSVLEAVGEFAGDCADDIAGLDRTGLRFENGKVIFPDRMLEIVEKARQAGLQPVGISRQYGGLQLPFTVRALFTEIMYRLDGSLTIAIGCVNLAEILEKHASAEICKRYLPELACGNYAAAMCLTEADHGSDLANIRTRATKKGNNYVLNGSKRFITHGCGTGDKPALLLVLARTGDNGARGLSFFIASSENVEIGGIERKLGLHCSPTCELIFENTPAELIGEEGLGLIRYVMGMLNGARIGIAQQGTGIATAALMEAEKYACERIQFGMPLKEIPAVKEMLDGMHAETMAMRCLMLEGARAMDLYSWRGKHLQRKGASDKDLKSDVVIKYWEKMAGLLTPLSKLYCSEICNQIAYDALQIHGGAGFTEDYDIARIYRDARITTIYDGTSQIQSNAALGPITTGMTDHGFLKEYIDNEWLSFDTSQYEEMELLRDTFESIVKIYRNLPEREDREGLSTKLSMATARFLACLLFFRSTMATEKDRLKYLAVYLRKSANILNGLLTELRILFNKTSNEARVNLN